MKILHGRFPVPRGERAKFPVPHPDTGRGLPALQTQVARTPIGVSRYLNYIYIYICIYIGISDNCTVAYEQPTIEWL